MFHSNFVLPKDLLRGVSGGVMRVWCLHAASCGIRSLGTQLFKIRLTLTLD